MGWCLHSDNSFRQLHGEAMDASMLADDGERIYTDDFSVREGELDLPFGFLVFLRLVIGRVNHGAIQDEEVGVGDRKSVGRERVC